MNPDTSSYFQLNIRWKHTLNFEFPYRTRIDNQIWKIRLNDFPEEPMYTLIIDNEEIVNFDDWPKNWSRLF